MIIFKYKERFIQFIIYSIVLILIMLALTKVFNIDVYTNNSSNNVVTSIINYKDDLTDIYVEYPRFNDDKINRIITDDLYKYIKDFKTNEVTKSLHISYKVHYVDKYVNIEYHIKNSLNNIKADNLLLNLDKKEIAYISNIYDEGYLKNEIATKVKEKYSIEISKQLLNDTINNYTYFIGDNNLEVFFNNNVAGPSVLINFEERTHHNDNQIQKHKYIVFTYDDGPSEYTENILDTLNTYNSSATFFMLGEKMKFYDTVVKKVYESNSEVGSYGYSRNSSEKTIEELENDNKLTNEIFNEITNDNIIYYKNPYDISINNNMIELKTNIDSKDWLVRNTNIIYNNVIKNACDGCVVLFHDTYKETLEATKKIIPELNNLGYEVVSISKLNEIKNQIDQNDIINN